jgi:hypothetical protein
MLRSLEAPAVPPRDWHTLSDETQLSLTRAALVQAVHTVAGQAEFLALEMESGSLADRGGPDALRLFAAVLRVSQDTEMVAQGNA